MKTPAQIRSMASDLAEPRKRKLRRNPSLRVERRGEMWGVEGYGNLFRTKEGANAFAFLKSASASSQRPSAWRVNPAKKKRKKPLLARDFKYSSDFRKMTPKELKEFNKEYRYIEKHLHDPRFRVTRFNPIISDREVRRTRAKKAAMIRAKAAANRAVQRKLSRAARRGVRSNPPSIKPLSPRGKTLQTKAQRAYTRLFGKYKRFES